MVEIATDQAKALVSEFTIQPDEKRALELALSEVPIGDEYGCMTDEDWKLFNRFSDFADERGVKLFFQP